MNIEVLNKAPKTEKKGSILFVHGVCHDANCWNNYLEYFSEEGFSAYALSLRGHGNSDGYEFLNDWGLSDYVTDVVKVALSLGEKPIVVGHSMGGAIVQKLIGEHEALFSAAVLLAPATKGGLNFRWKLKTFRKSVWQTMKFTKLLNSPSPSSKDIGNSLFLDGRLDLEALKKLMEHLQPESKRAQRDLTKKYTPYYKTPNIPILVIGSENDRLFPAEDLYKTAQAYNVAPVIVKDMCHDMMVDPEWESGAKEIYRFIQRVI